MAHPTQNAGHEAPSSVTGRGKQWLIAVGCLALLCSLPLEAQQSGVCQGPSQIEQDIAAHPSAPAYDALGAYFAQHRMMSCALKAFQQAVKLAPASSEAHYNLGIAYLQTGSLSSAITELKAAAHLKPENVQTHLALGVAESNAQQWDGAIAEFRTVLRTDPASVPALDGVSKALIASRLYAAAIESLKNAPEDEVLSLDRAIAYSKNGDPARAIDILSDLVAKHPAYAQAHANLGIAYTQQSRFREAAHEFEAALKLDPSDDEIRLSSVKALVILAQFEAALPIIDDYTRRKPNDFEGLSLLGVVLRGQAKYAQAEPRARDNAALRPNDYEVRNNLGAVLAKLGKPAEARVQLEKALQLKPDSGEARFQLAGVLRTLGEQDQARKQMEVFQQEKQASIQQDVASTSANEANAYLKAGDAQKAVDLYRQSLSDDPKNAHTYYNLALALDRQANYSAERDALGKALELDAGLAAAHNQLGFLDLQAGQSDVAETQFKEAIRLDPQYAEAQNNLGVLYGQMNRNAEAEQLFRHATENNVHYSQAWVNLGLTLAVESRFPDAEQALEQALALDPDNPKTLTAQGMVLTHLERNSDAVAAFRKVVTLDAGSAGAHVDLGIALADQLDLPGALAEFSAATRLAPSFAAAHYNRGRVLLDLRRNDEARPELETATRLDPGSGGAWYLLGLLAKQGDKTEESIASLRKATQLQPDDADAHFLLGQELLRAGQPAGAIEQWRAAIKARPGYSEAEYNLSRLLMRTDPEEGKRLETQFQAQQTQQHITDRAQTLGNFALSAAEARDWPKAIEQLKEGLQACGDCSAKPQLHKDLGLIYCRSGDLKDGKTQLQEAQALTPGDPDITKALHIIANMQK